MEKEGEMRAEEIKKLFREAIDPFLKETYGTSIKDILDRIDIMNKEIGQILSSIATLNERIVALDKRMAVLDRKITILDKRVAVLDERTKIHGRLLYVLVGGTFGTLISIILTLIGLFFRFPLR
jgi:polyhydroxyalkanoate synthesis regulator phasin